MSKKNQSYITRDKTKYQHDAHILAHLGFTTTPYTQYRIFCGKPVICAGFWMNDKPDVISVASFGPDTAKALGIKLKPGEIRECTINIEVKK